MRCRHNLRASLALVILAGACSPERPPVAPAPPAPPVHLDDAAVEAIADLLRLEDRREFDRTAIARYLEDAEPEVRRRAALAAGRIRGEGARELLLSALADSAPQVRAEAAFALGLLGDTARPVVEALSARAMDDREDDAVRVEALAALGKLTAPGALAPIQALLEGGAAPAAILQEALLAVWRHPRDERSLAAVVPYLESNDPELRWRAAYALGRLGAPGTAEALIDALDDADPGVRANAARGLRAAVVDSAGLREKAAGALAAALEDPHPHVRINALRALAGYRDPDLLAPIAERLGDGDTNVAIAAAEALGALGADGAVATLEAVVRDPERRLALRGAALASLVRLAPERGVVLADSLAAGDWLARLYAARALGGAPWATAEASIRRLAADPDPRVAATALRAAAEMAGDSVPAIRGVAFPVLAVADPGTRAAALDALAPFATAADLPVLLDAYDRARHDADDNDAAIAAVRALGILRDRGVPVARSFFLRFPRSEDPVVRLEVDRRIGRGSWGPPLPIDTGKDTAFYVSVVRRLVSAELAGRPRPRARIRTAVGEIVVELAGADAPLTVHNFLQLAQQGAFSGTRWHRVVPNFVLQDGDPRGDGTGGPGYAIRDEPNRWRYARGTLGMALAGPDTGGSQFFITHSPQPHLNGGYTVFGRVIEGMAVADRVVQDDPILGIDIVP
jgi:cyclophilin family peptidyl-prolyl cis-trans isomerase/HEAT repeat protein